MVLLKDSSNHFSGKPNRPKPQDGWWVTAIHANLLTSGKVLINGWGRYDRGNCRLHRTRQNGESYILDPKDFTGNVRTTYQIQPIPEAFRPGTEDVLYCSGHTPLKDGRVLFTGGARYDYLGDKKKLGDANDEQEYGLNYFRVFDPKTQSFSRYEFAPQGGPKKKVEMEWYEDGMMWYPTQTRLPGGKILVAAGFDRNCADGSCFNRDLEIFDPELMVTNQNPWKTLLRHENAPNVYDPGIKDYTHSFVLPSPVPAQGGNGIAREILLMGYPGKVALLTLDPKASDKDRLFIPTTNTGRPGDGMAWDSSSALVGTGEILVMGGGGNPKAEAQRIDLYNPYTHQWRSKDTGITRHNPATTLLPDGTVLIINGEPGNDKQPKEDPNVLGDRRQPQIYDPYSDTLTTLAAWPDANPQERGYHSFSLLLADGRIMLGGGMVGLGQVGCERPDVRIFNPPYLFQGARPHVQSVPESVEYGGTFEVRYQGSALRQGRPIALMALGSETHSFDQNQRYVPLEVVSDSQGILKVKAPANSSRAPEGNYFLYLIGDGGAPSVGRLVTVK